MFLVIVLLIAMANLEAMAGDYIVKNGLLNMRDNLQQIRNILLENATIPVGRRMLFLKTREGEYGEHD